MGNWFKKAQAEGLDLKQPVQSLDGAPANPQQQQPPQQQVPQTYEEIVQRAPQVEEIVEWLKSMKTFDGQYQEALRYVAPAERLLEEMIKSLGIQGIGDIPELMQLFRNN
jgi:hypothetical protein